MKNLTKTVKAILKQMTPLNSQEAESIRENMVRMSILMGYFPYASFADDAHPTAQNPYPWTPDILWNMPAFQQITETWESDCGRCRGASLKLECGFKLLATITDPRPFIAYEWNKKAVLFTLTKKQIEKLAV